MAIQIFVKSILLVDMKTNTTQYKKLSEVKVKFDSPSKFRLKTDHINTIREMVSERLFNRSSNLSHRGTSSDTKFTLL